MPNCGTTDLVSGCWYCRPKSEQEAAILLAVSSILEVPQTPLELIEAASCWTCRPRSELESAVIQLLIDITQPEGPDTPDALIFTYWVNKSEAERMAALVKVFSLWAGSSYDPDTVFANSDFGCAVCRPSNELWSGLIQALCTIAVTDCTPENLVSGCWTCRTSAERQSAIIGMLCRVVDYCVTWPDAPSELAATAVSDTEIDLTWVVNDGSADSQSIERSLDGETWSEIATPAAGDTTYSDTGLDPETRYFYRVRCVTGTCYSDYSNVASATTDAATGTVYWGLADATTYDPSTFDSWDNATVSALLGSLNSEQSGYRDSSSGYFFNNDDSGNNKLGWFIVPDSYADLLAGIGMQYCEGSGVSPDEYVRQPDFDPPHYLSRAAILWAGYADSTRSNEWGYKTRTIGGTLMRFYAIGQVQRNTPYTFGQHPDVYWFEQDADFSQSVRSNGAAFNSDAWIRISVPSHPEFDSYGVWAPKSTWGADEGPLYFAIEGSPATHTDTPTQDYYCEPTNNITGALDGTISLNEFTLFVFPQSVSQAGTTVFWGMAPAATYDPYDCQSWDQSKVDAFFGSLSSEVGSIRALPYDFTAGSANCVAWLVVPYSYPTAVADTGFASNYVYDGTAGPGQVYDFRRSQRDGWFSQYYIVCNTHFKTALANSVQTPFSFPAGDNDPTTDTYGGWNWFALKYNGVMYRAYPFVPMFPATYLVDNSYLRYWNDGVAGTDVSITVTTV